MPVLTPLEQLNPARFEAPATLKKLASSSRKLAELKGMAASIPNQGILILTLALQEAKDSSEIREHRHHPRRAVQRRRAARIVCQPRRQRGAALPPGAMGRV